MATFWNVHSFASKRRTRVFPGTARPGGPDRVDAARSVSHGALRMRRLRRWSGCGLAAAALFVLAGCASLPGNVAPAVTPQESASRRDERPALAAAPVAGRFECQWGPDCTLDEVLHRAHACALLVVQRGRLVHAYYEPANTHCHEDARSDPNGPAKRYGLASVAKSVTSSLFGHAWSDPQRYGRVGLDDKVSQHVAGLPQQGHISAVTIRQALTMSSALAFDVERNCLETCTSDNPGPSGSTFLAEASQYKSRNWWLLPGQSFRYSALDTTLVGLVVESVLARTPDAPPHMDDALAQWFFRTGGGLAPGYWKQDKSGVPNPFCCFYLTAPQLASLGQVLLDHLKNRHPVGTVSLRDWLLEATSTQILPRYRDCRIKGRRVRIGYGYQWWTLSEADGFVGAGTGGQFLHILPQQDTVIVQFGSWPAPWPDDTECSVYAAHRFLADRQWD